MMYICIMYIYTMYTQVAVTREEMPNHSIDSFADTQDVHMFIFTRVYIYTVHWYILTCVLICIYNMYI